MGQWGRALVQGAGQARIVDEGRDPLIMSKGRMCAVAWLGLLGVRFYSSHATEHNYSINRADLDPGPQPEPSRAAAQQPRSRAAAP